MRLYESFITIIALDMEVPVKVRKSSGYASPGVQIYIRIRTTNPDEIRLGRGVLRVFVLCVCSRSVQLTAQQQFLPNFTLR